MGSLLPRRSQMLWRAQLIVGSLLVVSLFLPFVLFSTVTAPDPVMTLNHTLQVNGQSDKLQEEAPLEDVLQCLTPSCIDRIAASLARPFPDRTDQKWCISKHEANRHDDGVWRGILLVKVPKGASSTSAGIVIRISQRQKCEAMHWMHRRAYEYANHSPTESLLITTVREPADRAVSTVFFHVISRSKIEPTDANLIKLLRETKDEGKGANSDGQGGFQLRYTTFFDIPAGWAWNASRPTQVVNPQRVIDTVRETLSNYSFVLVTDRMDESLVAMALNLGVTVGDVLVTASKVAGSRYHLVRDRSGPKCLPTVPSVVSNKVRAYLDSDEWRAANYGDYLFHAAANRSLDLTIEQLGRQRFEAALAEYKRLRAKEQELCAPHVQFPCTASGNPQPKVSKKSCYLAMYDFGCGYKCIDKMLEEDEGLALGQ